MSELVIVGLSILGGGVAVALVFYGVAWIRTRMTRGWTRTTGIVVNRRTGRPDGGLPAQYTTFQWTDHDGTTHQHTSSMQQSLGPRPGRRVPSCTTRTSRTGPSSTATSRVVASSG